MRTLDRHSQFVVQRRRCRVATAGKGPDHQELTGTQLGQQVPTGVAELTGHPMPLNGVTDRFAYDETDFRCILGVRVSATGSPGCQ